MYVALRPSSEPFAICGTPRRGGALIETMIAMVVVALFLSGIHMTNSRLTASVSSSLDSAEAARTLCGRAEQLRASTWTQITDPAFLQNAIFAVSPDASGGLANLVETIDVTAHLADPGEVAPIQVRRLADGTVTVLNAGDGTMAGESSVRIDVTTAWTARGGRSHVRQMTLVASQGGFLGRN